MIDKFQRIAQAIQILRLPSVVVGFISLTSVVVIILTSKSREGDEFLIPSVLGVLWAVTTYSVLVTFRSVPEKADKSWKLFSRLKRSINRSWYWFIGVVFLGTTAATLFFTYRVVSIWFRDYGG